MPNRSMPWPRGETAKQGITDTGETMTSIIGRDFYANSNYPGDSDNGIGGNVDILLTAVKNTSPTALTFGAKRLRRGLRFSTADTSGRLLLSGINGFVNVKGARGAVLDGAHGPMHTGLTAGGRPVISMVQNDVFYIVKEGPTKVPLATVRSSVAGIAGVVAAVGTKMAWAADGGAARARTGDFVFGLAGQTFVSTDTGQEIVIHVGAQLGSMENTDGT